MIVFDLDGTLALDTHRVHHLFGPKPLPDAAWKAYFAACGDDEPNWPLIHLLDKLLWNGESVEVWSGRSMSAAAATANWFARVFDGKQTLVRVSLSGTLPEGLEFQDPQVSHIKLSVKMRHENNRIQDDEMKRGWLQEARVARRPVTLAFEDRQRVVDMWRGEGVVCCQVARGDF